MFKRQELKYSFLWRKENFLIVLKFTLASPYITLHISKKEKYVQWHFYQLLYIYIFDLHYKFFLAKHFPSCFENGKKKSLLCSF